MKILQINNYHYLRGGAERIYLETSSLLKEKGHDVINFSVRDHDVLPSEEDEYFVNPPECWSNSLIKKLLAFPKFIYSFEAAKKLDALLSEQKPDIAHLHIFYGRLTSSILSVLNKHAIPIVITVHEYRMLCPIYIMRDSAGKICEKCASGSYLPCIIKRCNRNSIVYSSVTAIECFLRDMFFSYSKNIDAFIMVSQFIANIHQQYRPELNNKIRLLYNFVDIPDGIIPPAKKCDYYLYFGRLSREKGILTLLKAWREISDLRLKIVGNGPLKSEILRYIKNNNLNNVEIIHHLEGEELNRMISGARFTIVPSEWYESFGLTIAESFARGTPVIGADIGAIPELIKQNETGYLFHSSNHVSLVNTVKKADMLSDDEYYNLCVNSRYYANENFNQNIYYEKLLSVYTEVVASG